MDSAIKIHETFASRGALRDCRALLSAGNCFAYYYASYFRHFRTIGFCRSKFRNANWLESSPRLHRRRNCAWKFLSPTWSALQVSARFTRRIRHHKSCGAIRQRRQRSNYWRLGNFRRKGGARGYHSEFVCGCKRVARYWNRDRYLGELCRNW